jgi:hypothetical protein
MLAYTNYVLIICFESVDVALAMGASQAGRLEGRQAGMKTGRQARRQAGRYEDWQQARRQAGRYEDWQAG